jgi:RimJ/RimL family protein N-acetyltransferase
VTRAGMEKFLESTVFETKGFIIETKDGSRIGYIWHFNMLAPYMSMLELGYGLVPSERGKGCCTEAAQLMVDYLFLSKDIARIQATTHTKNVISQKVLEKVGFKREGTLRKTALIRGEWTDMFIFSILREEWKEPKILAKTS